MPNGCSGSVQGALLYFAPYTQPDSDSDGLGTPGCSAVTVGGTCLPVPELASSPTLGFLPSWSLRTTEGLLPCIVFLCLSLSICKVGLLLVSASRGACV